MRKFLSLFAFMAIVLTFAACGGNSNEPELGGFQFKITSLSSKAQIIVTPSKPDSYFFSNYVPASEVENRGSLKQYLNEEWLTHPFDYLVAIGVVRKGVDKYSESMDFDKDYIAYAFYVEKLENGDPKIVGEIAYEEYKTLPQYRLNGAFTVSATKKVCFASSNMLHVLNEWPYCVSDQYTRYSRTSGSPYDLMEWSMAEFFSNNVLTAEEWKYLLKNRPNAAYLFAHAKVNGENGLIILPDNWQTLDGIELKTSYDLGIRWDENSKCYTKEDQSYDGYEQNKFTKNQWQELEYAGAVFLPAAGVGGDYKNVCGYYWSSTVQTTNTAYALFFGKYYVSFNGLGESVAGVAKTRGCTIRFVWEVQ